ncbi:MAG: tyrosine--tRNA ligase [Chloroflexi bacterium]|nr:tyrosine--tRNA ligase [Chloroflexota bacterium]
MTTPTDLLSELTWRGLIQERSDGLEARLARGPISAYVGFDASATSLHVGNLLQVFLLTHLQRSGGRPVIVVGGATGMIGDPSGKSSERNLLDDATIARNAAAIRAQLERFMDFSAGPTEPLVVDNREWLGRYSMVEFLRDVGKHFTVPYMLAKESVQQRLSAGMSFTEFSYMTLQAADFLHLHREHGVDMQMGGADQWGNITAGLELIRRVEPREEGAEPPVFALCSPLLLTRSGQKMGKSEKGAVFLDATMTSPYEFYQYWLNDDDVLAVQHLKWLTFMTPGDVDGIAVAQAERPHERPAQRALALDLTARVHGREQAEIQVRAGEAAFSGAPVHDPEILETLYREVGGFVLTDEILQGDVLGLAVGSGLFSSRSEARRAFAQGGVAVGGERVTDSETPVPALIDDRYLVIRAGRKRLAVGRRPD